MYEFRKYYQAEHQNRTPVGETLDWKGVLKYFFKREKNTALVLRECREYVPYLLMRYLCKYTPYYYRGRIYSWDNELNKPKIVSTKPKSLKLCIPLLFNRMDMEYFESFGIDYFKEKDHNFVDVFWGLFNDKFFRKLEKTSE